MLKSLELFGFKSFADRTRFDFSYGITCVVGPNGSGKSNVVDAIEVDPRRSEPQSLRSEEMTDVIFNGSSGRKAGSLRAKPDVRQLRKTSCQSKPLKYDRSSTVAEWRFEYLINGATARPRTSATRSWAREPERESTALSNRDASGRFCNRTRPLAGSSLTKRQESVASSRKTKPLQASRQSAEPGPTAGHRRSARIAVELDAKPGGRRHQIRDVEQELKLAWFQAGRGRLCTAVNNQQK